MVKYMGYLQCLKKIKSKKNIFICKYSYKTKWCQKQRSLLNKAYDIKHKHLFGKEYEIGWIMK